MNSRHIFCISIIVSLLTLLLGVMPSAFSQTGSYNWSGFENRAVAQSAKHGNTPDVKQVHSPHKVEVGATGSFALDLPVLTVPGRNGLNLDLRVSYKPGVKVTDEASWVGLGWDLEIGSITRNPMNSMDNSIDQSEYVRPFTSTPSIVADDVWRDTYSITCPAGSGKLLQFRNASDPNTYDFVLEEWRAWRTVYDKSRHRFIVTSEDGTRYVFGFALVSAATNARMRLDPPIQPDMPECDPFGEWKLTAVLSPDYVDGSDPADPDADLCDPTDVDYAGNRGSWIKIDWSYDENLTKKKFYSTDQGFTSGEPKVTSGGYDAIGLREISYPWRITTPTHVALFETQAEANNPISELLDDKWLGWNTRTWDAFFAPDYNDNFDEKKRVLRYLRLYRKDFDRNYEALGEPLQVAEFRYRDPNTDFAPTEYKEYRNMLKSIAMQSGDIILSPYEFEYHDILTSQRQNVFTGYPCPNNRLIGKAYSNPTEGCVGTWGWYNSTYPTYEELLWIFGDNDDGKMWTLKKVTYPTGGTIEFDYESNRYVRDFAAGDGWNGTPQLTEAEFVWGAGARLTKQIVNDLSSTRIYEYSYSSYATAGTRYDGVGRLYTDPFEHYAVFHWGTGGRNRMLPPSDNWLYEQTNHPVLYGLVKELQPDNSSVCSFFRVAGLDENLACAYPATESQLYSKTLKYRGELSRRAFVSASGDTVRLEEYDVTEGVRRSLGIGSPHPIYMSASRLSETTRVVDYDEVGQQGVEKTSSTTYNANNGLPSLTVQTNSDGSMRKTFTKYPCDYSVGSNPNDDAAAALKDMCELNIISPVVETWIEDGNATVYQGNLTKFAAFQSSPSIYPAEFHVLKSQTPVAGFQPSSIVNGASFACDARYSLIRSWSSYDDYGNLLQETDASGLVKSHVWGYKGTVLIGDIEGASPTQVALSVFDDGMPEYPANWFPEGSSWTIADGALMQTDGSSSGYWESPLRKNGSWIDDGVFEVDIRFDGGGSAGHIAVAKYCDQSNMLRFEIRKPEGQVRILARKEGVDHAIEGSGRFHDHTWYHLKGEVVGSEARLLVDGKVVLTLSGSFVDIGDGTLGLCTELTEASFDNARAYPSDALMTSISYDPETLHPNASVDVNGMSTLVDRDGLGRVIESRTLNGIRLAVSGYPNLRTTQTEAYRYRVLGKNTSFELFEVTPGGLIPSMWTVDPTFDLGPSASQLVRTDSPSGMGCGTAPDGALAVVFETVESNRTYQLIKQSLGRLVPGHSYAVVVSFRVGWISGAGAKIAIQDVGGNELATETAIASEVWQRLSLTYTPETDQEAFLCLFGSHSGDLIYDNVLVSEGVFPVEEGTPISSIMETVVDAVGRTLSTSVASNEGTIRSSIDYDNMGRPSTQYKPRIDGQPIADDNWTTFEYWDDPLNRIKFIRHPGSTFHNDAQRYTKLSYGCNAANELDNFPNAAVVQKTVTRDENGRAGEMAVQYSDKFGNAVASARVGASLNLKTYSVFNIVGNMIQSTPPKGSAYASNYSYSTLGQLTHKSSPDANPVDYRYDKNGNLRFVRDGVRSAQSQYVYMKYDSHNRLVEEGVYNGTYGFDLMADVAWFPNDNKIPSRTVTYDVVLLQGQRFVRGRPSGIQSFREGSPVLMTSYSYDEHGRVEWVHHAGLGTSKRVTYDYDLQGNLVRKTFQDLGDESNTLYTYYDYDRVGRISAVYTSITGAVGGKTLAASYSYATSGQVTRTVFGEVGAQTVDYSYNERDWLAAINDIEDIGDDKFAERIQYFTGNLAPEALRQYNGNIAAVETYNVGLGDEGQGGRTAYQFTYDAAGRLINAQHFAFSGTYSAENAYSLPTINYDDNGNLTHLTRMGENGQVKDDFVCNHTIGNRLGSITGHGTYNYDDNGNVKVDPFRQVTNMTYDHRNLPVEVERTGVSTIMYSYDASGARVRKQQGSLDELYVLGANGETEAVYGANGLLFWNIIANGKIIGRLVP